MKIRITLVAAVVAALAGSTGTALPADRGGGAPDEITIAYQPGLGYAALILMKEQRLIEKRYPRTKVNWRVLASGTPITQGVITGDIQIGAMGTGPFLVGWARNVKWKIIAPLNLGDLWLMARDRGIRTIGDLRGKRIATPTNTSIQAVMLRKMAQARLGDARTLDRGLVAMDHPDGMQALLTGQIDAHFTSPPFQFQERARGAHVVAKSYGYFGAHSFLVTVMTEDFYGDHTAFARFFYNAVARMNTLIKKQPGLAGRVLQRDAGGTPNARQFRQWLVAKDPPYKGPALSFTTRPLGLMRTANFMVKTDQLSKMPRTWRELVFAPVYPTKGS